MKRLLFWLSALILFSFASCTPVSYPDSGYSSYSSQDVRSADPQWQVASGVRKAIVSFSPIVGAENLILEVKGESGEEKSYGITSSDFYHSRFQKEIKGLKPETSYSLSLVSLSKEGDVKIEKEYSFTTGDTSEERPEYEVDAYLYRRNETSAEIKFSLTSSLYYRIVMWEEGKEENAEESVFLSSGFNSTYTFTDLNPSSTYHLSLQHGYREGEWGVMKKEITIPPYSIPESMILSLSGETFSLTGNTEGRELYMLKRGDRSFLLPLSNPESFSIPLSMLNSLEKGEYYVVERNGGSVEKKSNALTYISPIICREEIGESSITLYWSDSEDIIYDGRIEVEKKGENRVVQTPIFPSVVSEGGEAKVEIGKLASNTTYNLSIRATFPGGEEKSTNLSFTTGSYAGHYTWYGYPSDGKRSAFSVDVIQAPSDSAYPYYIYVSSEDPAYDGSAHRIMPLLDEVEPGYKPISGNISYSSTSEPYMKAYRWNASKWNKTSLSPSYWRPERVVLDGDSVSSYVYSRAMGMDLTTKTSFVFRTVDGKKELVFTNVGEGQGAGFVNVGLFTNPQPSVGLDKYSFVLSYEGEVK